MKIVLVLSVLVICAGCCGEPVMQLRSPVSFGMGPAHIPGPSQILVPQTYAPTYAPTATGGCFGLQYAPPPAPASAPCP